MQTHRRSALVTGASRGLGLALTEALVSRGWQVYGTGRNGPALERALAPLGATPITGDVADPKHRLAVHDTVGELDLLVHNAGDLGVVPLPHLAAYPLKGLRSLLETTVIAPLALTQLLLPRLRASAGAVLAVSSDAAGQAYPGWGGYGAAKAALEQWVSVLGAEEPEVRCYAVDPGDLHTELQQQAFPGEDISDRPLPASAVPALLHILGLPGGRYVASELAVWA